MDECSICRNDYGGQCIPTLLTCCLKGNVCFECAESDRAAKISNLTGNRKKIQCMFCNKLFHSVNDTPWIVNKPLIEKTGIEVDMSSVRDAQAARQLAPVRKNIPHRSRRTHEEEDTVASTTGANDTDQTDGSVARASVCTDIEVNPHARKRTNRQSSSDLKLTVTVNGERYSADTMDDMDGDEKANTEFKQILCNANQLYRIRQFVKNTKCDEDPHGRRCSDWALSKGYCATSDNILSAAGHPISPADVMGYIKDFDVKTMKKHPYHNSVYCRGDMTFASMEKGDMIAMNVPGPAGKGEAFFGVVTSNKLVLMGPEKCAEEGFPALDMLGGNYEEGFKGLMLREVKWLRKGYMRDLPGQKRGLNGANTVPWLVESGPFWIHKCKNGLDILKQNDFLKKTQAL